MVGKQEPRRRKDNAYSQPTGQPANIPRRRRRRPTVCAYGEATIFLGAATTHAIPAAWSARASPCSRHAGRLSNLDSRCRAGLLGCPRPDGRGRPLSDSSGRHDVTGR